MYAAGFKGSIVECCGFCMTTRGYDSGCEYGVENS